MRRTIVEDRVLTRVARDAVGCDEGISQAERVDAALGRAVVALRVMGVGVTPEVAQAVRDDIALVLAGVGKAGAPALRAA